jgi:hypothetical protein
MIKEFIEGGNEMGERHDDDGVIIRLLEEIAESLSKIHAILGVIQFDEKGNIIVHIEDSPKESTK